MAKRSATLTDIANKLDIDVSTVSKALKNHPKISDTTKERVKEVAQQLNYKPNNIATALVKGKTNLIGVMVPNADETFFSSAIRGIEETAKQKGYRAIIFQSHDNPKDEIANIETMYRTKVDGVIASPAMNTRNFDHYQDLLDQDIPLILFDRYNDSVDSDVVAIDDFKGAYQAVTHLIEQGCRHIAHIAGFRQVHIYEERIRGYRKALEDNGLKYREELILECNMNLPNSRDITEKLLDQNSDLDAIFASSDNAALGAIQVLKERGIKVPEECAVVGFSNNEFTSYVTPTITTVEQHSRKMGIISSQLLLDKMEDDETPQKLPRKTILTPELIIRESSVRKK